MTNDDYDKDSITSLDPIEHIRERPGNYIPGVDIVGLHHILREAIDNCIDEVLTGFADTIKVVLNCTNPDIDVVSVQDNGRGIPVGYRKDLGMDVLTAVLTKTLTGGKFDNVLKRSYKTSAGLHGVGIKATNALSTTLLIKTMKNGTIWEQQFSKGKPTSEVTKGPETKESGTIITFTPDEDIFEETKFDTSLLKSQLFFLSSILPKTTIQLKIINGESVEDFTYKEDYPLLGIHKDSIITQGINESKKIFNFEFFDDEVGMVLEYYQTSKSSITTFINTIHTYENGSHLQAVLDSLASALKRLTGKAFTRYQIQQGMFLTLSAFYKSPIFRGQHKGQVSDTKVKTLVYDKIYNKLYAKLSTEKEFLKYIVELVDAQEKLVQELDIRQSERKIKDSSKNNVLPGKLSVAHNATPKQRELIIVEGDSAAGVAKMSCNRSFQEILPIKGKILNAFRAGYTDLLNSEQVTNIFISLGSMENTNTPLRSHRCLVLGDPDPDACFVGETKIPLLNGEIVEIKDLVGLNEFWLYSCKKDGTIVPGRGHSARITKKVTKLVEVTLDNGKTERCTPEHRWQLRGGAYKQAQYLEPGDSLMPLDKEIDYKVKLINNISLDKSIPVYDITVDEYHNFALSSGVFVHNCHIISLVLGLFTLVYPSFIKNYSLEIIHPPRLTLLGGNGDIRMFGHSTKELKDRFKRIHGDKKYEIHWNKGLGEISPKELVEFLDPKTRKTTKVVFGPDTKIEMERLMGELGEVRKELLRDYDEKDYEF